MYEILGKSFETEKEYLDFIVKNEDLVIDTKKSAIKYADGFGFLPMPIKSLGSSIKAEPNPDATEILVKIVINSTNILDSHKDVHIPGLWDKSLRESGHKVLHLQEHGRKFKDVIARGEDLKTYTETVSWKSLGFDMEGKCEILGMDSLVKESQNKEMFNEYMKGNVDEHSVGMLYVKMVTCINDDDYPTQKENWDKYESEIHNRDALKNTKVFWAQTESKAIEGSSVLMGSNSFTPTRTATPKEAPEKSAIEKWLKS